VENLANLPVVTALRRLPSCEKSGPITAEAPEQHFLFCYFPCALHSFHTWFTAATKEDSPTRCKS